MIRSTNNELGEYDLAKEPEHVAEVWSAISTALPQYWTRFVNAERGAEPAAQLAAKFKTSGSKRKSDREVLAPVFERALSAYEKEAQKYRVFFDVEAMEEYQDDPNSFKQGLMRDVPVIANTLRQRRKELAEWQKHFKIAKGRDLLEIFANVLDFTGEWIEQHPPASYRDIDDPSSFGLDALDDDETMSMQNVVGMGIKSIVLYHLHPDRLPARGRDGLYGLYFLSGRGDFGLPSGSSEFLMVNDLNPASDGSLIMDQNYWYPYGLYSLYALRVFRWMEQRLAEVGMVLDQAMRYVYVDRFFEAVCDSHEADLKTMRAHERFEIPA